MPIHPIFLFITSLFFFVLYDAFSYAWNVELNKVKGDVGKLSTIGAWSFMAGRLIFLIAAIVFALGGLGVNIPGLTVIVGSW